LVDSTLDKRGYNDKRDAYRHALWVGYMTQEFGKDTALFIANTREAISDAQDRRIGKKDEAGTEMDYHNNKVASEKADNPKFKTHEDIERAMKTGVEMEAFKILEKQR